MRNHSLPDRLAKWFRRHVGYNVKTVRRQIRRAVKHPALALGYYQFRRAAGRRNWHEVKRRLPQLAAAADAARDIQLLTEMSHSAERLDDHVAATQWAVASARLCGKSRATDWTGEDLADATLLISFMETEKQGLSIGLNMAGYVAAAAQRAHHCVLVVERRLVPLFTRTLPAVEVRAYPAHIEAQHGTRLVTANALILRDILGTSSQQIKQLFRPLLPNAATMAGFRRAYRGEKDLPLVGIAWWSSHFGKDLPSIECWTDLIRSTGAIYVVVQYGNLSSDMDALIAAAPKRVVLDKSVDQLVDMDRFAAQLSALDGLVTISNTGAHLAGALELPTLLIRDDWFRRSWPVLSNHTPWYPETTVIGKEGRPWLSVFDDIKSRIALWRNCRRSLPHSA